MLFMNFFNHALFYQITRLLPDAVGTTCSERVEKVHGTEYSDILRVPFRTENGIVRQWISRFEVWPYLETYTEVNHIRNVDFTLSPSDIFLTCHYIMFVLRMLLMKSRKRCDANLI